MAQLQEAADVPETQQTVKTAKSWLLKARAIKSKLEDGVTKRERDDVVQEIRTVLGYATNPAAMQERTAGSSGAPRSARMPTFGSAGPASGEGLFMDEMSVGADFDMEASLRLGQELAPIELWAKEPKQIVALQGIQLQQVVCGASHV